MACCKIVLIVLAVFGVICIVVGAVLGFAVLPNVIIRTIEENVRLEYSTPQFERWKELPFPLMFKIYFFAVENPELVLEGATPVVVEKGPYIYKQSRWKQDVEYNENDDTLFYYQGMWFEFDKEASHPFLDNDTITTLNVPLMGIFQTIELFSASSLPIVDREWRKAFPEMGLFHDFTVKEYLFDGVKFCMEPSSSFCELIADVVEEIKTLEKVEDGISFAFLRHKNVTLDGSYLIRAGIDKIEDLGLILEWQNTSYLENIWGEGDICRKVRGRDFTIYPPHITSDDTFDIFQSDICRVVTLEYVHDEEFSGIPGHRQELKDDTLTNTGDQSCYCSQATKDIHGEANCWPDGFMDLHNCMAAMVVMSNPHFLDADKEFAATVEGLNPNPEKHTTYVVFEPNTGTPLKGAKRMQFNMVLRPIKSTRNPNNSIEITRELKGAVLPLIWVEESMELPPNLIRELREQYFDQLVIVDVVTWVLIGFGILLFIGGGVLVFIYR